MTVSNQVIRKRGWHPPVERQRDTGLHPEPKATQESRKVRQASLQSAQRDRHHVRQVEGLAARRNPLRQVPKVFLSAIALAALVIYWL
jgi:hypothetical protein